MAGNRIYNNLLWRFLERCSAQVVSFLVSIILARLLEPSVFGTVSLVLVFTTILQVFVDSGLGNALIQKKDADDVDFSSVFFFNLLVCLVLYGVMYVAAPYISKMYDIPTLTPVIRVLSLTLIISGIKNVQQAFVSRKLLFKKLFYSTMWGTFASAIVGLILAYNGYGVWAVVSQYVVNTLVSTVVLWMIVDWRPTFQFSKSRLYRLLSYGWKLLASSLILTINEKIRQLIIGKYYSPAELAYYNNGEYYPYAIINNVNASIDSVMLPVFSEEQDNIARVKELTRKAIKTSCYVVAPIMIGFAAMSHNFVALVLSEKWIPAVPYIMIFCVGNVFRPLSTANLNAIKAVGRSDMILKLEIIKMFICLLLLLATMRFGVLAIALGSLASYLINQIVNASPNKTLLSYGYIEQFADILPYLSLAIVMGGLVYCVNFVNIPTIAQLMIQIIMSVLIYWFGSVLFKFEAYMTLKNLIISKFKHR